MPNVVQPTLKVASNKNVTGKKRLNDAHHPAPRRPFHPQTGMKNFQA
jgi:hypothetical protein